VQTAGDDLFRWEPVKGLLAARRIMIVLFLPVRLIQFIRSKE
jgi:hypothetical protein